MTTTSLPGNSRQYGVHFQQTTIESHVCMLTTLRTWEGISRYTSTRMKNVLIGRTMWM